MIALLWRIVGLSACAAGLTACVSPYQPPTKDEPHALLKYRRVYEKTAGTKLSEVISVESHPALSESSSVNLLTGARIGTFLLHPGPAELTANSSFSHTESRRVQEAYYQQEPYTDRETYNCGTGTQYRTCTRSVTKYRQKRKTRWVTKNVDVVDSTCAASKWIKPEVGGVYLLELHYQESKICRLSCFEQTKLKDGKFENQPCPMPSAEEIRVAKENR